MESSSKSAWWIIGAIVVIALIILGIAKYSGKGGSYSGNDSYATTTDDGTGAAPAGGAQAGANPGTPGAAKPAILVKIDYVGGVCQNNQVCRTEKYVTTAGDYYVNGYKQYKVNGADTLKVASLMESADFGAIKAKAYAGACPPTANGSQITYTFYTSKGAQSVSNCQTAIDYSTPLFKATEILFPNVN